MRHSMQSSIYRWNLYSASSRQLLRGAPSPGPGENKRFKELVKRAPQIPWKRADFRWETIPNRGAHNREGPMLFNGGASMRHHKITSGSRAKRLSASTGRSQDKMFQQVGAMPRTQRQTMVESLK